MFLTGFQAVTRNLSLERLKYSSNHDSGIIYSTVISYGIIFFFMNYGKSHTIHIVHWKNQLAGPK